MISSSGCSIFVYGTLQSPHVLRILLGRVPTCQSPAVLAGYQRFPVAGQVFPGMIPDKNSDLTATTTTTTTTTQGVLLQSLSGQEVDVLDYFEGDEYIRRPVTVDCCGNMLECETYVWNNPLSELEMDKEWRYPVFCDKHLEWYLESTVRPLRKEMDELGIGAK